MSINGLYTINYEYRNVLIEHFKDIGQITAYKKDSLIEFEYKKLDYVYLILDGVVKQFFLDPNGSEKIILLLSKGDMFGEITMFQKDYDRVITKAYSPTVLGKIERHVLYEYLHKHPSVYDIFTLMITTKFRLLMSRIYDNSYLGTKERLLSLLKRLSVQLGCVNETDDELSINFTHEELANMIGSTRSTVTKLIKKLESEGKLTRRGKKIIIA